MGVDTVAVAASPPRARAILRLVVGRGTFRVGSQFAAATLVTVWDGPTFSQYAGALGLAAWLTLISDAPERAALKVVPRTRRLAPAVARLALRMAVGPPLLLVVVLVPVAVAAPRSPATTYLAAGAGAACLGLLMCVAGLHRLRGAPVLDTVAFGTAGLLVVAVTAATLVIGWAPQVHLLLLLGATVAVTVAAIAALPRDWLRPPRDAPRRRLVRPFARLTGLLGLTEMLDALSLPVVYLVLTLSARSDEAGALYLALLPAVALTQLALYLLRVAQPSTSYALRSTAGRAGLARARRLLRHGARFGLGFAALLGLLAALPPVRDRIAGERVPAPAFVVVVVVLLSLVLTVTYAGYLVENTSNDVLTATVSAAGAGLVTAALLAIVLVPWLGAFGGIVALCLAVPVKAVTMGRLLSSPGRE